VPELAEAASRTGDVELVRAALQWLSERTRAAPTEWALGIEARVRALLSQGDAAEPHYRESIDRLGRTHVRVQLGAGGAATLRTAGARGRLRATGATARKRTVETREVLTAQEAVIARLAREGLSNPEIGSRLFISARTVQSHLGKVFAKLAISSRGQLDQVLASDPATTKPK
jgi:DNA-binding CsgD family transcriptional regulator